MVKLSTSQATEAVSRYADGESTYAIANDYGVSPSTIQYLLRSRGVKTRTATENHRKHVCDTTFFDSIDSEAKAYALGFIAADGCVTTNPKGRPNTLQITLAERDEDHLKTLRDTMGSQHPIRRDASPGYSDGPKVKLQLNSVELCDALGRAGVGPRKTLTHEWPGFLEPGLLRHYLRGYSDGDGHFSACRSSYIRKSDSQRGVNLYWGIIGSDGFCRSAQQFLVSSADLKRTKLAKHRTTEGMSSIVYGGTKQVSRIYHLLYDGATVWMPRKRDVASPYIA